MALQGEYDGKCRPNIYGNTLVNLCNDKFNFSSDNDKNGNICNKGYFKINKTSQKSYHYMVFSKDDALNIFKSNSKYTIIVNIITNTIVEDGGTQNIFVMPTYSRGNLIVENSDQGAYSTIFGTNEIGQKMCVITTKDFNNPSYPINYGLQFNTTYYGASGVIEGYITILEGDYTNKPIPDYFTGMKSSFEDKLVPENLYKFSSRDDFYMLSDNVVLDGEYIKMTADGSNQNAMIGTLDAIKPSTTYTIIADVVENTLNSMLYITNGSDNAQLPVVSRFQVDAGKTGIFTRVVTTNYDLGGCVRCLANFLDSSNTTGSIKYRIMVVEGDYTNYDFTDYDSTKAGKYKVDYKVTGKNKFDKSIEMLDGYYINDENGTNTAMTGYCVSKDYIRIQPNTTYYGSNMNHIGVYDKDKNFIRRFGLWDTEKTFTTPSNAYYIRYQFGSEDNLNNVQLEEGTTATTYEPYKESIKTLYLNSPLLEGDTIEQSGNNIIHNHRYSSVVLDGSDDENWRLKEDDWVLDNSIVFAIFFPNGKGYNWGTYTGNESISDKIPSYSDKYLLNNDVFGYTNDNIQASKYFRIPKSYLTTQDVAGFKKYLQQNPITVVYELKTPTQEIISTNDNLLLDSYTNGHLDVDSVVPIDKVVFKGNFGKDLKYLYPNTEYTIQLESDNNGKIDNLYCSGQGTTLLNLNVIKGINKFSLTTLDNPNPYIDITGIGFNASKIVVTPKVDNDFGYFKGMKSVGECEDNKIEILSQNNLADIMDNNLSLPSNANANFNIANIKGGKTYTIKFQGEVNKGFNLLNGYSDKWGFYTRESLVRNCFNSTYVIKPKYDGVLRFNGYVPLTITSITLTEGEYTSDTMPNYHPYKSNKKEILLNEPLRGLPNGVCDKYVIIDGKWYIERNCGRVNSFIYSQSVDLSDKGLKLFRMAQGIEVFTITGYFRNAISNKFKCITYGYGDSRTNDSYLAYITSDGNLWVSASKDTTVEQMLSYMKDCEFIYELPSPTYEPIDYNPFEVYTDTTHISNNSNIPCNMVIKNTGFNCILKPNTTYTVSSNNGLSTVTTKDSIGDSVLRFYDKDTSKITKMNKVLVLEGDYVTGNPPIPAFFKGMESAFEQELVTDENDEHYGKYKIEVLAKNKNLFTSEVIDALCTLENWVGNGSYRNNYVAYNLMNFKAGTTYTNTIPEIKVPPNFYPILFLDNANGHFLASGWYQNDTDNEKIVSARTYTFSPQSKGYFRAYVGSWNVESMQKLRKVLEQNIQTEIGKTSTEFVEPKQNKIQFFLNEPLRGVGNVKDKVYVKEDKVVVERNCSSATFDGSEMWYASTQWIPSLHFWCRIEGKGGRMGRLLCDKNNEFYGDGYYWNDNIIFKNDVSNFNNIKDFTTWLQQNPTTVVYQLATPVYEEVECDLSKLALEGYNHGTLFYNSNIPVTTQFYDFKVNIKDMLIPNEIYYITFIADRVKDITINLSGVQVNYKTSMGYNKVPVQLGDVVNTNFSIDSRGVELSDLMISTSTSLIYVKDMNDVCVYDETSNKYSITITSRGGNESDKRVILLDYPLLRLNKDIYDRLYYNNKDSKYRIDKKVFKHKFTNDHEYSKYAVETNDTYYSSFISLNETIKDYVVITNEKVKTVKVEDDKYYFKIKWSDLGVSDKTEANGNQGMKDFFNNNEVYLYYATDGFVEIVDGLSRQTLKVYQPETIMNFLGNTTTTVTIVIPKKNI